MLEIQSYLGPHKGNPPIGHLWTGWLACENLRVIFHFCLFSLPVPMWKVFHLAACWGRSIHKAPVYYFHSTHCWPLGLGRGIAWEDVGKRVWEFVCRNSYVLRSVGHNAESEHSWGLAQTDKVLHLTFQQGITIQWGMMSLMESSKLWLALAGSCKLQGCHHLLTRTVTACSLLPAFAWEEIHLNVSW